MKKILIAVTFLYCLPIAVAGPQDSWIYVGPRYDAWIIAGIVILALLFLMLSKKKKKKAKRRR